MKDIIAFGGSNSSKSINKALAIHAASMLKDVDVTVLDLNDYKLPVFSIDLENESGIPENAQRFLNRLHSADAIVLSLAEHNGAYSTAFKNIFDWMSRIDGKLWHNTPMLLMATSPGKRGGKSVLEIAKSRFPFMGGNIVADFSLPSFYENFNDGKITDKTLQEELAAAVDILGNELKS
ncbi:MAG: NAD(P)H-dependent oxidoreductase [Bacteroidia bacterium]|nr:NAD(P)H-dependent oxidoreductase [Bacteroidia bacterium]MBT8288274.1 NAD(P)H-dependent oxidoreductase [Bacteroidia bacterium]